MLVWTNGGLTLKSLGVGVGSFGSMFEIEKIVIII